MAINEESLYGLKKAVELSPDNAPLRLHYADSLYSLGHYDKAENEYSRALGLAPDDVGLKCSLAQCFYQLGKYTQALVIVEDLVKSSDPPARAFLIYSRLLLNDGNSKEALLKYEEAIRLDPSLADQSLAERLGAGSSSLQKSIKPNSSAEDEEEDERVGLRHYEGEGSIDIDIERPTIDFVQVGGMEEVKEEIRMKIIHPLNNPEIYKAYGKQIGGGILLYGPPGCGKTHIARATAGEIKASFLSVGINDVLDMWLGNSEKNLHEIFENARRNTPAVLFFDEVDALAASRTDLKTSNSKQVINQFLAELDGVDNSNDGILVLAATNAPWHLDSAFRRPGRFDRIIFVPPPDKSARAEIFRLMTKGKPVENIDYEFLAKKSDKYSGADLKNVIDVAVESKLEKAIKSGVPEPLTTKDIDKALKKVRPSTAEWFSTARNYAMYANQGGAYDEILKYFKK